MSKIPKPKPPAKKSAPIKPMGKIGIHPPQRIKKSAPPPVAKSAKTKKNFVAQPWSGTTSGEKVIVYAITKMGKTTLASLLPDAVFIGADDGGRKIKHPVTGADLNHVPGVESFQDVRDALHSDVFDPYQNIVVDTITEIEQWSLAHTLNTVPRPKSQGGGKASNVHDYGYHEGFVHWCNTTCLLLPDFDRWVRKGKNVIILAQETTLKWKTSGPEDFLMAGPNLHHSRTASAVLPYVQWSDHVFRIAYANTVIQKGRINPVSERAIQVKADATFFAGSRTIPAKFDVVEFKEPADDSIWRLLFNENLDSV